MRRDDADTRERLLRAASELFARTGFHGAKIRDIAHSAGANVAAANYHFGSKAALYLDVLRTQFAEIRSRLAERAPLPPEAKLARMGRAELIGLLSARLTTMIDTLLDPHPSIWGLLLQREMCDPSDALPNIVEEFMRPQIGETRVVLGHLFPALSPAELDRCAFSLVGQVVFYHVMRPAVLQFLGREQYARGFTRQIAEHVIDFSLGGMERLAAKRTRSRRAS